MKAISLLQPWAELVVIGAKHFETRSWQTKHSGRILIHASKGNSKTHELGKELVMTPHFNKYIGLREYYMLSFGAIIGECEIDYITGTDHAKTKISEEELAFGDYSSGRYAWKLIKPVKYKKPIPFKGSLSLWEFPDDLLK